MAPLAVPGRIRAMDYPLKSIKSGEQEIAGIWVSIGFSSAGREFDVLHIVGGEETDPRRIQLGMVPIYLERYDQMLSCYQGADKILIEDGSVTVTLNKIGQDALDLPETLHFVSGRTDEDFQKARNIFTKMKTFKSGRIIHVV
jgi:hypothetical protein